MHKNNLMMQKVVQLKTFILNVLILSSVFCTTLIHAMNRKNRGIFNYDEFPSFKDCIIAMRDTFVLDLDFQPKEYVKLAITDLHFSQFNTMHKDVKEYYESMINKVIPDKIQWPIRFCQEFTSDKNKIKELHNNIKSKDPNLYTLFMGSTHLQRIEACNSELAVYTQGGATQFNILKNALYNYVQCSNNDTQRGINKHNPLSYGYFYLEDIANRVLVSTRMFRPWKFCYNKHVICIQDHEASSEEEEASPSNQDT